MLSRRQATNLTYHDRSSADSRMFRNVYCRFSNRGHDVSPSASQHRFASSQLGQGVDWHALWGPLGRNGFLATQGPPNMPVSRYPYLGVSRRTVFQIICILRFIHRKFHFLFSQGTLFLGVSLRGTYIPGNDYTKASRGFPNLEVLQTTCHTVKVL